MYLKRCRRLLEEAEKIGCDLVIAATPQNLCYTTGLWGYGMVLISHEGTTLFTSKLEAQRALDQAKDCAVKSVSPGESLPRLISKFVRDRKICLDDVPWSTLEQLRKETDNSIVCDANLFFASRIVKDDFEASQIAKAGNVLDKLFEYCAEVISPRLTERRIGAALVARALELGCDPPNYHGTLSPFIIASGPNGAYPHTDLTDRRIQDGDLVVVDMVLRHNAYACDATRTYGVGRVSKSARSLYELVRRAQERGIQMLIEGVEAGEVDHASRNELSIHGYGDRFVHSTGHGIGLDVHEPPWARPGEKARLQRGTFITVEPGVYLPGRLGIRIEDTFVLKQKPVPQTRFTKDLLVI